MNNNNRKVPVGERKKVPVDGMFNKRTTDPPSPSLSLSWLFILSSLFIQTKEMKKRRQRKGMFFNAATAAAKSSSSLFISDGHGQSCALKRWKFSVIKLFSTLFGWGGAAAVVVNSPGGGGGGGGDGCK